ncbi:Ulp1 protease family, carboxy-terminal domain protein [Arachis hypogaea]|nr:Ulp1 protease family, carboxy-terminal domain protein [Arachis hypogaea]
MSRSSIRCGRRSPLVVWTTKIKEELMTDLVRRDEIMLAILSGQAKQIQAITDLLSEHNRVIGVLTYHIAQGNSNGKGNVVDSKPVPAEQAGGPARTLVVGLVGSQHKDSTNGLGAEARNINNSKAAVHYGSEKLGVGRTSWKGISKYRKKEVKPISPKRKLEFCEEEDFDFGELGNIRQSEHGSPFTFYTHTGWQMTSEDMPKYMDICFWPPPGMQFFGHELVVAAYVFAKDLDQNELLVQNDHRVGNREALWTLRPGEEVVDDVINLVAVLTAGKDQHRWWLPTTILIYVAFHSGRHWYLMIVDMWEEKLVYLDSLKRSLEREGRINQILDVNFIDHILTDKRCYEKQNITPKKVSSFKVFKSMDCGVWVSQWMILTHLWASYELEKVNDSTRMLLAIDLVMGSLNPIAEEVTEKTRRYWDRSKSASYKKGKRQRKKANSPTGPLSPSL